jgi:hypothetical protein
LVKIFQNGTENKMVKLQQAFGRQNSGATPSTALLAILHLHVRGTSFLADGPGPIEGGKLSWNGFHDPKK